MSMDDKNDDTGLEAFFNAGRSKPAMPSAEFMARLADDASAVLAEHSKAEATPVRAPRIDWLPRFFTASGLSGAAVLGVWIGFAMPETLDAFSLVTDDTVALSTFLPGADLGAAFDE